MVSAFNEILVLISDWSFGTPLNRSSTRSRMSTGPVNTLGGPSAVRILASNTSASTTTAFRFSASHGGSGVRHSARTCVHDAISPAATIAIDRATPIALPSRPIIGLYARVDSPRGDAVADVRKGQWQVSAFERPPSPPATSVPARPGARCHCRCLNTESNERPAVADSVVCDAINACGSPSCAISTEPDVSVDARPRASR